MTEKSESISMKTFFFFFFFFFGDHLIFGRKNVRISDFGRRMWLNFDEYLFFFFLLETTCFWAEITNVFQRFPRNYMCNFWWLCFVPPNNFYGFTPLFLMLTTPKACAYLLQSGKFLSAEAVFLGIVHISWRSLYTSENPGWRFIDFMKVISSCACFQTKLLER